MSYNEVVNLAISYGLTKEKAEELGMAMVVMGNPPKEIVISAIRMKLQKESG